MASYSSLPPVGYEMEPEEKDQEMRIEFFLEAFRGYIAQIVDYKDLMLFEYFSPDQRRKFRNLAKNADNAADVTDQMIETILLMKDKPNRYSSLVKLFETEGVENEKVLRILKGEKMPSNSNYQKKKIQRVMKALCDNLDVEEIIPSLEQHKLIVSREKESLLKMNRNYSNFDAAMDLMLIVPNRQEGWYLKFILCLIESGHEFLAEKVDSDVYQKILKYKEKKKIQNSDRSLCTEDPNELFELCEDFGERSLIPVERKSSLQDIFRSSDDETLVKGELSLGLLPEEILRMDENSIRLYKKALMEGKQAINNIRVMIVGHCGVGKTTLTKRLFGETVDVNEDIASTNGIDVHIKRCKVRLTDATWLPLTKENNQETFYNRFACMISEFSKNSGLQQSGKNVKSSAKIISSDADRSCNITSDKTSIKEKQADNPDSKQKSKQQENKSESLLYERELNENRKAIDLHLKEMIEDIKNRCTEDSSKDIADLSLWDFAGQYVFYGTHQIFLSRRAIYLLVTDLSQQVDSIVVDDCYIDSRGETRCKISDFVTFWLNSIHSFCASGKSKEPPVILVGTYEMLISLLRGRNRN